MATLQIIIGILSTILFGLASFFFVRLISQNDDAHKLHLQSDQKLLKKLGQLSSDILELEKAIKDSERRLTLEQKKTLQEIINTKREVSNMIFLDREYLRDLISESTKESLGRVRVLEEKYNKFLTIMEKAIKKKSS